jgi:hypothetical protein
VASLFVVFQCPFSQNAFFSPWCVQAANRQARAMIQANESVADSQDDIRRLAEFATSMIQNEALVRSWKDSGVIVAGKVAEERMQILRGNCKTLLLWL